MWKISLLRLSLRIVCRLEFVPDLYDAIKFFAKAPLSLMFKWNFLLPKWNSLIPILPIKLIPFLHAIIFQTGFRICSGFLDIRLVIAVSDRWKRDRSRWWFFRNFIEDFLTFTLLVISLVPTWTMRSSGFSLIMSSGFSRIFPLVPPEKFTVFTSWLTLRPFSEIPFTMESPVNTIFFSLRRGSVWVSLF